MDSFLQDISSFTAASSALQPPPKLERIRKEADSPELDGVRKEQLGFVLQQSERIVRHPHERVAADDLGQPLVHTRVHLLQQLLDARQLGRFGRDGRVAPLPDVPPEM